MRFDGAVELFIFLHEAQMSLAGEGELVESLVHSLPVFSVLNGQKGKLSEANCGLKRGLKKGRGGKISGALEQ